MESPPELLFAISQWLCLRWPVVRQDGPGLGAELTTLLWHKSRASCSADAGSGFAVLRMRSEYA